MKLAVVKISVLLIAFAIFTGTYISGFAATPNSPVWIEQGVIAGNGAKNDQFGKAVAVSGNIALVAAPNVAVGNNSGQGVVYVFTFSDGIWSQTAKFTANDGVPYEGFGHSVALDGTTALVGTPNAAVGDNGGQGAVYVFSEADGTWSQVAKLTAADGVQFDSFGWSVALDGSTALIGADNATIGNNSNQGAAYIFSLSKGVWSQVQKLTAKDGAAQDGFGYAVALDGITALVGAQGATISGNSRQGAAYVFADSKGTWGQTAKLVADDGAVYDNFGDSVALDGTLALCGAPGATVGGNQYQGAAYVFTKAGGSWSQADKLSAADGAGGDNFGFAVALSRKTALVGAQNAVINGYRYRGAVYTFADSNGTWSQNQKLIASNGAASDNLGISVAFDGTTALAGADIATRDGISGAGAAYFYGRSVLGLAVSAPSAVAPGDNYVSQVIATNQASVATPAVRIVALIPAAASYVSASASQGDCSEDMDSLTCDFGSIRGNAGTAKANITLKATHIAPGTIKNTAEVVAQATPPLVASATTAIVANSPPVASDGTLATDENKAADGTLKATDAEGNSLTFSVVSQPANGTVQLIDASKGSYSYTPDKDFSGKDSFAFVANNGQADSNVATVSITVKKTANSPPVASNGTLKTDENKAASGTLKATDSDGNPLTFSIASRPSNGSLKLTDASKGSYTYTPDKGYSGKDSFAFLANDGQADSNVATINITVKKAGSSGGGGANAPFGLAVLLLLGVTIFIRRRLLR
jgi:uncharacterized lipoprotein NlpE involved in copper resistance